MLATNSDNPLQPRGLDNSHATNASWAFGFPLIFHLSGNLTRMVRSLASLPVPDCHHLYICTTLMNLTHTQLEHVAR